MSLRIWLSFIEKRRSLKILKLKMVLDLCMRWAKSYWWSLRFLLLFMKFSSSLSSLNCSKDNLVRKIDLVKTIKRLFMTRSFCYWKTWAVSCYSIQRLNPSLHSSNKSRDSWLQSLKHSMSDIYKRNLNLNNKKKKSKETTNKANLQTKKAIVMIILDLSLETCVKWSEILNLKKKFKS